MRIFWLVRFLEEDKREEVVFFYFFKLYLVFVRWICYFCFFCLIWGRFFEKVMLVNNVFLLVVG